MKHTRNFQEILDTMEPDIFALVVGQETNNPLQDAFSTKRVLHADVRGAMPDRAKWPALWQAALEQRGETKKRSAYIHIPFCLKKCLYCGFFQNYCQDDAETAYIDRLVAELKMNAASPGFVDPVNAVFIGGGTPSSLSAANAGRMLQAVKDYLPLANDCELTLEGRIYDLIPEKMETWLEQGVNRISLGVQSFDTKVRRAVGRLDDRETVLRRLEALSAYNQAAVIVDLIYGLPFQTPEVWQEDIATLKTAAVDGWDLYQLNVYENSALKKEIDAGRLPAVATIREQAELFAAAHNTISGWPVSQISVCHWAKTNRERNMYNIMAQQGHTMLPFGAGAGGKVGGFSLMQDRDMSRYMQRIDNREKPIMMMMAAHESVSLHDAVKNQLKLGYLDIRKLAEVFDPRLFELEALLAIWEKRGLLQRGSGISRLTVAGQFWYGNITQSVLECVNTLLHGERSWTMHKVAAQG
ncbi:MAG: coproporphyrinogen oxidase [Anaerospora sp.]|jgi:oxygen-independent coproporphyrinogen-3 oxidase|nr:coproporphyrinogen oxidase [Anaerospora sp.]